MLSFTTFRRASLGVLTTAAIVATVHIMNYYDTYNKVFNVKDADIDAVLTFYGARLSSA